MRIGKLSVQSKIMVYRETRKDLCPHCAILTEGAKITEARSAFQRLATLTYRLVNMLNAITKSA